MSLGFIIPGADFSASPNEKLKAVVRGFDKNGLAGLWLAEAGTIGVGVSSIADQSGNNKTATLMSDFVAPLKTTEGLQSEPGRDQSFIFDSGVPLTTDSTIIFCGYSKTDPTSTDGWEIFASDTNADIPTDKTDAANNATRPNIAGRLDRDGESLGENVVVMDRSGLYAPSYVMVNPTASYGKCTAPFIAAMRVGSEGEFTFKTYSGFSAGAQGSTPSAVDVGNLYSSAGNFCFGHWTSGSSANPEHQAVFCGAAIYSRLLTESEMNDAMVAMATIMTARGVSI